MKIDLPQSQFFAAAPAPQTEASAASAFAGRAALPLAPTESPLPAELDALISSYVKPEEARTFGEAANWKFSLIHPMLHPCVQDAARSVVTLDRTHQDITDADLADIRRLHPALTTLNVTGSTYNGSRDYGWTDISNNVLTLSVPGVPTLHDRVQFLELQLIGLSIRFIQLQMPHFNVSADEHAPAADTQIAAVQREIRELGLRLEARQIGRAHV